MNRTVSEKLAIVRRSLRTALFARTLQMRSQRAIVSFTFDDFPCSAVSNGARLLEKYSARGTFYLTGSYCGRVVDDIQQYRVEDLTTLAGAGHEIGCHTFTHPRVSTLSTAALNGEIDLNAAFLAYYLPQTKLRTFAYPFGDLSFLASVRLQSKFVACRSSEPGLNTGTIDLGRLRSIRLYSRLISPEDVSALIKQSVANTAWLIFYTHDVAQTPSSFGCTPALLEHALHSAIAAGAAVYPVDTAVEMIGAMNERPPSDGGIT